MMAIREARVPPVETGQDRRYAGSGIRVSESTYLPGSGVNKGKKEGRPKEPALIDGSMFEHQLQAAPLAIGVGSSGQ
jgi:hypothetical protein